MLIGEDAAIRKWGNRLYWVDLKTLGEEAEAEIIRIEKIEPNQMSKVRFTNGGLSLSTGASTDVAVLVSRTEFRLGCERPISLTARQTLVFMVASANPLIAISDQIIGWGAIDCETWSDSFFPMAVALCLGIQLIRI